MRAFRRSASRHLGHQKSARLEIISRQTARKEQPMKLTVNNREVAIDADPAMPLLWALRDVIGLTGTKFGCGAAQCGACTVHLDGQAIRSCITPISEAEGKKLTTIEAATDGTDRVGAAVHTAWV
jgi:isoquinoline 1-oxidoreductase alpha subunit